MRLIPIQERFEENERFTKNPLCRQTIEVTIDFYKKVGFVLPWIGYYVEENSNLVGSAGFKGPPLNGTVEIAYGTFDEYRKQGIGTAICKKLVELSIKTDPSIKITATTFQKENFSTRILEKNNFVCVGTVNDVEDGEVWQWVYKTIRTSDKQ
jgi:[ribosomal protein S5]-alanine N-acetyltransferase